MAVIVSIKNLKNTNKFSSFYREKLFKGIEDIKKGRVIDGEKAMQKLKTKYDL